MPTVLPHGVPFSTCTLCEGRQLRIDIMQRMLDLHSVDPGVLQVTVPTMVSVHDRVVDSLRVDVDL